MDETISIVTPVFNREFYSDILINNLKLLDDNKIKYEMIIIDDASTDYTKERVLSVIKDYQKNVSLISNKINLGVTSSKTIGIKKSSNSWVLLLDSDNLLNQNSLKELRDIQYSKLSKDIAIISFNSENKEQNGDKLINFKKFIKIYFKYEMLPMVNKNLFISSGCFYENVRGFEGATWLKIASLGYKFLIKNINLQTYNTDQTGRLTNKMNKINNINNYINGYRIIFDSYILYYLLYSPVNAIKIILRFYGYMCLSYSIKKNINSDSKAFNFIRGLIIKFISSKISN